MINYLDFSLKGADALHNSYFGNGPNSHIVSDLYCSGSESSLLSCRKNFIIAAQYCGDGDVAGATCLGKLIVLEIALFFHL